MSTPATDRYTSVAVILHWLIALSILGLIAAGWWMTQAAEGLRDLPPAERRAMAPQVQAVYQMHKSMGLTVLILSLVRLGWRLANPPPPMPAAMPGWQKAAASLTHIGFYVLMIGLPLSGWAYVSTGFTEDGDPFPVATLWFGLFEVPHIPLIAEAAEETRKALAAASFQTHEALVYATVALLGLHIGAAIKHHVVGKDGVAARMIPFLKRT
jgi:cytochrome b561